jgi:hypothetical protein
MTQVILRLTLSSNSIGPFNVYVDSLDNDPVYSEVTRDQLTMGLVLDLQGSTGGQTYQIIVENLQENCENQTIIKEITVFDNTPEPTPEPTPTPTQTNTPQPTQTPTPTITPTSSLTPTPSVSMGVTPSTTPTLTATPTNTVTPTVTPTPSSEPIGKALLLIEPISLGSDVASAMLGLGTNSSDFLGFSMANTFKTEAALDNYMQLYSSNLVPGLLWYELDIPLTGPRQGLFDEIGIPAGTVNGFAWYTFVIPPEFMQGQNLSKVTKASVPNGSDDTLDMESTVYNFGSVYYNGPTFLNKYYKFYTTWLDQGLRYDNSSSDLFFRGTQKTN